MTRPIDERRHVLELWRSGSSRKAIARVTGIPRSTVREWVRRCAGVAQWAEATDLKSVQWGFESLHQHQHPAYVYLLGLYLGNGYVSRMPRTYVLRIFLNRNHPAIIAEAKAAISRVLPTHRVGAWRLGECLVVRSYWLGWPSLLPQTGRRRKHQRRIVLEPWQENLVKSYPEQFVRGCIHSDGCRHRRSVRARTIRPIAFPTDQMTFSTCSRGHVASSVFTIRDRLRSTSPSRAVLTSPGSMR